MSRLKDKIIVVTGSGSGIGRSVATVLAKDGATVVVADRNLAGAEETVSIIKKDGGMATAVEVDISDEIQVEAMIENIVETHGRLDCAVNNAGVEAKLGELVEETTKEDFNRLFSINVTGTWLCLKHELVQMKKQGFGSVVNMSSVLGTVGCEGFSSYVASKHAVVGLTKCAALENAQNGIRVNACCPAAVQTPMLDRASGVEWAETTPMKRVGTTEEVGKACAFLCSDDSSFTTGHTLLLDGGLASA